MKQVHWQLPFWNYGQTKQYRIDIYAEGEVDAPIQLVGAAMPFTTDEDKNEDRYENIRTSTGAIHIINDSMEDMTDILPANNIDRPVRLVRIEPNGNEKIEWQGFLSCETHTQEYSIRPHALDLNVNSVLEAMDSVFVEIDKFGIYTIHELIEYAMVRLMEEAVMPSMIEEYFYPTHGEDIMHKYLDTTMMFSRKEISNENNLTYEADGKSVKYILSSVAGLMGWVVREKGHSIYFEDGKDQALIGMRYNPLQKKYLNMAEEITPVMETILARDMEDAGMQNTISRRVGAKAVEVVASVEKYNLDISIPDCPTDTLMPLKETNITKFDGTEPKETDRLYLATSNTDAYANVLLRCFKADIILNGDMPTILSASPEEVFDNCAVAGVIDIPNMYRTQTFYAGAMLAKGVIEDKQVVVPKFDDILFVRALPYANGSGYNTMPAAELNSVLPFCATTGYINIQMNAEAIYSIGSTYGHSKSLELYSPVQRAILQFGDKFWNGTEWQDERCTFNFRQNNEGGMYKSWKKDGKFMCEEVDGLLIPIPEYMHGLVTLSLIAEGVFSPVQITGNWELLIHSLTVGYQEPFNLYTNSRGNNTYRKITGMCFPDTQTINTNIASDLNNQPSPSVLMIAPGITMKDMQFHPKGEEAFTEKPERLLLEDMKRYYGQPRTMIDLEVKPQETPLPLVRIVGYDGKTYLPLSESRDWRADKSTIQCFEAPDP